MAWRTEILIIGGGVIGLAIARELRKRGAGAIRIIEKGRVGREASWAAAGILAPQVEADDDGEFFKLCFASNQLYPQFASELLDETGVDIELDRRGTIYVGFDERDEEEFDRRYKWQREKRLRVDRLDRSELLKLEPSVSPDVIGALLFPDDGQVENRKLVEALSKFAELNDISIDEEVSAKKIVSSNGRVTGVLTDSGEFSAGSVIIAAGAWSSLIDIEPPQTPLVVKPIRGQMLCYRPDRSFNHVIYSRRGYVVPRHDGRLLAGATVEDVGYDKATTVEGKKTLVEIAAEIAPGLGEIEPVEHWAGLRPRGKTDIPYIGPVAGIDGLFAAVGHFRNGILLTPITARMAADDIKGSVQSMPAVEL
jgi:glycine oxidase